MEISPSVPTMYDVAKRAGVSTATVSAVLNRTAYVSPELTKRVKDAVQELDYTLNHLAHSLQTRSTKTVGMLIPDVANPDPFYAQVVKGAEDVFRNKGYLLLLGHTYNRVDEQSRYLAAFRSRQVDGVLLFQAPGEDEELRRFLRAKKPITFVGRMPRDAKADVVATDIVTGTRAGITHLIKRGHRRIGLVTIEKSMSVSEARILGWRQALKAHSLPPDEDLLVSTELSVEAGRVSVSSLLKQNPTAIFSDNLVITTGALAALRESQLQCPQDVELMSSDDADWLDVFQPPISTVAQPSYELGVRAAEVLLKRIRYPRRPWQTLLLQPELKIRGGVAKDAQEKK